MNSELLGPGAESSLCDRLAASWRARRFFSLSCGCSICRIRISSPQVLCRVQLTCAGYLEPSEHPAPRVPVDEILFCPPAGQGAGRVKLACSDEVHRVPASSRFVCFELCDLSANHDSSKPPLLTFPPWRRRHSLKAVRPPTWVQFVGLTTRGRSFSPRRLGTAVGPLTKAVSETVIADLVCFLAPPLHVMLDFLWICRVRDRIPFLPLAKRFG